MLNSKEILYSSGNNDECYTPDYWVKPILKYIPAGKIIWCPFDTEESEFVKQLRGGGWYVIHSHIDDWKDFFEYDPGQWDIIISNPPFTNKRKFFERALSFWKPFALIMTNTWLNDDSTKTTFQRKRIAIAYVW